MVFTLFKMQDSGHNYKTFQRNRTFRRFAFKIGNVLCITPWYDFEKKDLKNPTLNKICASSYCLILGLVLITAKVMEQDLPDENIFEKILSLFSGAISIFLTQYLIFGSTFIQQHTWEVLLRKLSTSQLENCCNCKTIKSFYVQFLLGHVFFLTTFFYHAYTWVGVMGYNSISFVLPFTAISVPEYYCFLYSLIASNMALVIKCLYQEVNVLLEKYVEQFCLRNEDGKSEEKLVKYILDIGKQYRYIAELVSYYNKIFGWVSLLIFWHAIIQLLRCVNVMLDIMDDPRFSWWIFMSLLLISMLSMIQSALIILSCEMATSTGEQLERLSHVLQEYFGVDSVPRRELFNLVNIVKSHKPKFTAANFFVINKGTILGILHITTTYLIVIIEFNAKIHERYFRNST